MGTVANITVAIWMVLDTPLLKKPSWAACSLVWVEFLITLYSSSWMGQYFSEEDFLRYISASEKPFQRPTA